jgi:sulfur carrier protein
MRSSSDPAAGACSPGPAAAPVFQLNGSPRPCPPGLTISSLLEQLEAQGPGVAVELNEQVIPRLQHPDTLIEPGDRIEVVRLVGGG